MVEFDPFKLALNSDQHGIDLSQGQKLWADSNLIVLSSKYQNEERYLAIGSIPDINWTASFTERNDNIRIISVRDSRSEEKLLYERNN